MNNELWMVKEWMNRYLSRLFKTIDILNELIRKFNNPDLFPTTDYGFHYPNDLCIQNAFFNAD